MGTDAYPLRLDLERVVLNVLRDDHGPDAVIVRPMVSPLDGRPYGVDETVPADPLTALAVARRIADTAAALLRDFALQARATGRSWADIAAALRITDRDSDDPALDAFDRIAPHNSRIGGPSCTWRCGACGQRVTDHPPYNDHPDDAETGHADTCPRHTADIDAYLADND